jgi:hypothetical protein
VYRSKSRSTALNFGGQDESSPPRAEPALRFRARDQPPGITRTGCRRLRRPVRPAPA